MPWSWRATAAELPLRLDPVLGPAPRPSARFELRVRRNDTGWQVRHGVDGPVELFASSRAALQQAREAARQVWVEVGTLSCVKVLSSEGTWEVVEVFGVAPMPR